jgi:hypothetical protein
MAEITSRERGSELLAGYRGPMAAPWPEMAKLTGVF